MTLTPLDIQNKEFRKSFWGYNEAEVDAFLEKIIESFEEIYKENIDLKEDLAQYKNEIERYEKMEENIKETMMLARNAADEVRKNAQKEAELIKREAQNEAERILSGLQEDINDLQRKYEELKGQEHAYRVRMKSFLVAQLELLENTLREEESKKYVEKDKENNDNLAVPNAT